MLCLIKEIRGLVLLRGLEYVYVCDMTFLYDFVMSLFLLDTGLGLGGCDVVVHCCYPYLFSK